MSTIAALARLRLRLNAEVLPFQLLVDVGVPTGYALVAATATAQSDHARLVVGALVVASTLSVLRLPAFLLMIDRCFGARALLAATGVSRGEYLAANAIGTALLSLAPLVTFCLASVLLQASPELSPTFWLALALYVLAMHGASLWLSSLFRSFGGFTMTVNAWLLATASICPVYYPLERVPDLVRPLIRWFPPTLAAELMSGAAPSDALWETLLLTAWAILSLTIGYAAPRWGDD